MFKYIIDLLFNILNILIIYCLIYYLFNALFLTSTCYIVIFIVFLSYDKKFCICIGATGSAGAPGTPGK